MRSRPVERHALFRLERQHARPDGVGVAQAVAGLAEDGQMHGVRGAYRVLLAGRSELLGREVARRLGDRVAHAVLSAVGAQRERRVDQAAEGLERVAGPRLPATAATASTASSGAGPAKAASRARRVRSQGRAGRASTPTPPARCDGARQVARPRASTPSARSRRASSSAGAIAATRAAASSTASGMPSRRAQMASTASRCSRRRKSGAAARARSPNSATAASGRSGVEAQQPLVGDP